MIVFASGWSVDKDGPGQRRIIYLKGCNMRCRWCANPESLNPETQMLFYPERSNSSVDYVCPYQAIQGDEIDRNKCCSCTTFECVKKWKSKCFELSGYEVYHEELADEIIREKSLFGSEGGVTLGGGEPTLQIDSVMKILYLLKNKGIHTAIESNASTSGFKELFGNINMIIADLKCFTPEKHLKWTGIDNENILKNLKLAAQKQAEFLIRIPLVNGFNTDELEMDRMTHFLEKLKNLRGSLDVEILRMHHMGKPKYAALGMQYQAEHLQEPESALANKLKDKLESSGINIR